jgi:hypothetical protein
MNCVFDDPTHANGGCIFADPGELLKLLTDILFIANVGRLMLR